MLFVNDHVFGNIPTKKDTLIISRIKYSGINSTRLKAIQI